MGTARSITLVFLLAGGTAVAAQAQDQRTVARAGDAPWSTVIQMTGSHDGRPAFRLHLEATGVRLTADRSAVAAIREGGSLMVVHELMPGYSDEDPLHSPGASLVRVLNVRREAGGALHYDYKVNGVPQPFEAESEAWLARLLRQYHRR